MSYKGSGSNIKILLFIYLVLVFPLYAARVLIFSDPHGDSPFLTKTMQYMMALNPTHFLINGDYVKTDQVKDITSLFQIISNNAIKAKIPKTNIFITPGNWDHTKSPLSPEQVNNMLKEYGVLVVETYHLNGTVRIPEKSLGKTNIWVGHFPQFIIPPNAIPSEKYLYNFFENQAHILVTMDRKKTIPEATDLVVFSHTHIRSAFYEKKTKVLIINPGGLDQIRKNPEEVCSFALFDTNKKSVQFYNANNGEKIGPVYPSKDNNNLYRALHVDIGDWKTANNGKGNLAKIKDFLLKNRENNPNNPGAKIMWKKK